jgi:predicted RNase H-like HicB family nuclease
MRNEFTAIIEPAAEGGFWAYCLEVPGANGQGETIEEGVEDLEAAIELMVDVMREERARDTSTKSQRRVVSVG